MRKALHWLFPHPLLTLLLAIVWIMLQNEVTPGMVVFGVILGILIPSITSVWWPDTPSAFKMGRMVSYVIVLLGDIVVANIEVAWIVLTRPNDKLRTVWVPVPIDLRQPEAITVLAGTITLTPGTISADFSESGHTILVHTLDTGDPDGIRDRIKSRYEQRLKEIFA